MIARNPADFADPPRSSATRAPEMGVWSPDQLRTFLHHVAGHRLYAAYILVATTGLRRGELAGLRWMDVDLEASSISIRHTLISLDHKVEHSSPKTERGRRSIGLDPVTLAALRAHRGRQLEERLAGGKAWTDTGFVFTKDDGLPYHPQSLSSAFRRHSRRAGLPAIRYHDLRHSYATAALVAGIRPKVVSARLGHANIQITLDTYSHILPEMDQEAAATVASLILGEQPQADTSLGTQGRVLSPSPQGRKRRQRGAKQNPPRQDGKE